MAVGDVSRLTVVGRFQEQNIVNTFHYHHDRQTTEESTILKTLIDLWDTALTAAWSARHSDDYKLVGLKAFKHSGASKVPGFKRKDVFGDVAGIPHSAFVSRVITLYTDSDNHRRRGRLQLSGGENLQFDEGDGSVLNAEVTLMQTLADLILETVEGVDDDFSLCIPSTDVLPLEFVTSVRARGTPGIIRSRRIKGYFIG